MEALWLALIVLALFSIVREIKFVGLAIRIKHEQKIERDFERWRVRNRVIWIRLRAGILIALVSVAILISGELGGGIAFIIGNTIFWKILWHVAKNEDQIQNPRRN